MNTIIWVVQSFSKDGFGWLVEGVFDSEEAAKEYVAGREAITVGLVDFIVDDFPVNYGIGKTE